MTSCVFPLYFLLSLCSSVFADRPTGLKVRITDRAPDVLKSFAEEYLTELIGKPFQDFQYGEIIKIKRLTLTRLDVDREKVLVRFQQDSGLQFEFRDLNFTAELQREISVILIDDGPVVGTGHGVRATIGVRLNQNRGRLSLELQDCDVQADKINMKFYQGFGSWLTAVGELTGLVQNLFNTQVCPAIQRHIIPKGNSMLAKVTMAMRLSRDLNISMDYSLSGDVTVTPDSLDVPFTGVVYHGDARPAPPAAGVEPVFTESTRMVYFGVSEDLFRSAARALYHHGPLQLDVPQIGTMENYVLRVWGLPEGPCEVELDEVPGVTISQGGVSFDVKATARSLVKPDWSPLPVTCKVEIKVAMDGRRLTLQSVSTKDFRIKPTTYGGKVLAGLATMFTDIPSSIKNRFDKGVLIPLPERLDISQTKINYYPGFMVVGGDLNYTVQKRPALMSIHPSPVINIDPNSFRTIQDVLFYFPLILLIFYILFCKCCC